MRIRTTDTELRAALDDLLGRLRALREHAGRPTYRQLEALARDQPVRLPRTSTAEKLSGQTAPDLEFVLAFVRACLEHARSENRPIPPDMADLSTWEKAQLAVVRAVDRARGERSMDRWAGEELGKRARTRPWVPPRQLPPVSRHFVGRQEEFDALTRDHALPPAAGGPVVSVLDGAAGVGKTTLALAWAHRYVDEFPDGQLFLNLRGFDPVGPPLEPDEAIRTLLAALGQPAATLPSTLDGQAALYRGLLAGRRMLLVLDNAADAEQVRPLLPGSHTVRVLVTSRRRLVGLVALDDANPLPVGLLPEADAEELVARRIGPERARREAAALSAIVQRCGRLPLALCIVAARLVSRPTMTLDEVVHQLEADGLEALDAGEPKTQIRTVLSWSYRAVGTAAAWNLRLLARHPGPDISVAAAASLFGVDGLHARACLETLAEAHLIEQLPAGRYECHDLIRAFAADLPAEAHDADRLAAATRRLLDHYLHSAFAAAYQLDPSRTHYPPPAGGPGVVPEEISDERAAMRWFGDERAVLLSLIRYGLDHGWPEPTWLLSRYLVDFLHRQGYGHDQVSVQEAALAAATALGDPSRRAVALRSLGHAKIVVHRYDEALVDLSRARDLFAELGDRHGQAYTEVNIGWLHERQGNIAEALLHARRGRDLHDQAGDLAGRATADGSIAWQLTLLGDYETSLTHCEQALATARDLGDHFTEAGILDTIGVNHHHLGRYPQAIDALNGALALCREIGERYQESLGLTHLGETQLALGNNGEAASLWSQALSILDELEHPDAHALRSRLAALNSPAPPA